MSQETLDTTHLTLLPLSEVHFQDFMSMDQDPEVMKFIRAPSKDEAESRQRFDRILNYMKLHPGLGAFAAIDKTSKQCIGIGFLIHLELNPESDKIEVGYRLAKLAWGKGYATEIALALVKYGFDQLKLREIYGTTNPDHVVSQRVLMKAGLEYVGTAEYYGGSKVFRIMN